jgi:hypothetical protein
MKQIAFAELKVGDKLVYNNSEYIKTDKKQITCCRFTNAYLEADPNQKIGITPQTIVEVPDEQQ